VVVCAKCGRASPDDFGFCPFCGAPLQGAPPRQVRKFVSVLFCDLTDSTALGDRTDPEALRAVMRRYYENARAILEHHGGTVEKFVGDAVMAVFGIPLATEDDALRAVRAAVELRDALQGLGLEARIGVNTGEVVAGEDDTLVTGDAVNVAARLEQSAASGDVLLGETTVSLVRDAVMTEPLELSLRGKPNPATAYRLRALDAAAAGVARHLDRPMVGRQRELDRLAADFSHAAASRTSRLFTLIGPAGVGKSRLVTDFLTRVGDTATVAFGRALSYGDGITYWPLVEILIQLRIEPDRAISSSPADTQLATRAVFEEAARDRPLILVIDDLQWCEPPMLDLIEHIADWCRDVPILLLCIARPELMDRRPGWGGGKLNATSLLLEPLAAAEAEQLADLLLADLPLDAETKRNVIAMAEGNPLFLEEMAALARQGDGAVGVPPTIRALLQARLDLLNDAERTVVERGAVEGKVFHRGSVTALAPPAARDGVPHQLVALVRKELIRPDHSQIAGDDAYRFRHLLIRDTAYGALPKAVRAELHESFADWVESVPAFREQDEIIGYHLEQAAHYLRELGSDDSRAVRLSMRAGSRLSAAGVAAYERGDLHAVCNLLGRAIAVLPPGSQRRRPIPDLVEALYQGGRPADTSLLIQELDGGDEADRATAVILRVLVEPINATSSVEGMRAALESAGLHMDASDPVLVSRYERAWAALAWVACDAVETHGALMRAYQIAKSLGRRDLLRGVIPLLVTSAWFNGASASETLELIEDIEDWLGDRAGPLLSASLQDARGYTQYLAGLISAEEKRSQSHRYIEMLQQTGSHMEAIRVMSELSFLAWVDGDLAAREQIGQRVIEEFERIGDRNYFVSWLGETALNTSRLGRPQEALDILANARRIGSDEDIGDQILLDLAEAHALARHGEQAAARSSLASARIRAAEARMQLVNDEINVVEGELEMMAGNRTRAMEIADRLEAHSRELGLPRYAEALRRTVVSASGD
jgi:class 3 adenylate cyclase